MSTLVAIGLTAPPAVAAPPANDEITGARVINTVPSRFTVNTAEATVNPETDTAGHPCMGGNSVWYRFRPAAAVTARVVTLGSEFDTLLGVFRGPASNLTPVACNDDTNIGSAVEVQFQANTTYFIAISTCCSTDSTYGGTAVLRLYLPRTLTLNAPIVNARAGDVSGRSFFTGTVRCSNPAYFYIHVFASQRVGSRVARGAQSVGSTCESSRQDWAITIDSETGVAFRPGSVSVIVTRDVSDGFEQKSTTSTEIVTLVNAPNARPSEPAVTPLLPPVLK